MMQSQRPVSCVSVKSSLDPEAWRVLLESSSKPLVIKGQLAAWLQARSWRAADVCRDLSSTPPTTFKLCPRRDTPLHEYLTGGERKALFETDCTYVETTFANFKQWLEKNYHTETSSESPSIKLADELDSKRDKDKPLHHFEDSAVPILKKARLDQEISSPDSSNEDPNVSNPLLIYPGSQYWVYADYKYMCNLCPDVSRLRDPVDWEMFGFKDRGWRDSVLWVGSVGACTPCHYDSYGYNLVAQLSGKKSWTLFPPSDSGSMYPTRVPYEETSVFCAVDVMDPDYDKYPKFRDTTPYQVVLGEGDVLLVPKHWWHYVECVGAEPAVSINTWIELESDSYDKIKEALVRTIVSAFASDGSDSASDHGLLNPNEEVNLSNGFNVCCLSRTISEHRESLKSHDQQAPPSCSGEGNSPKSRDQKAPPSIKAENMESHDQQTPPSPLEKAEVESSTYRNFVKALTNETVLGPLMEAILKQK